MNQHLINHTKQKNIRCNTSCRLKKNTRQNAVHHAAIVMGQVRAETKDKKTNTNMWTNGL